MTDPANMTDDETTDDETLDEVFADILGLADDDEESPHQDVIEAAEDNADDEDDRFTQKIAHRVDSFEKKFEKTMLKQSMEGFVRDADDIQKGLMRELAPDIKSVGDFERAERVVRKQADKIRVKAGEFEAAEMEKSKERAAQAWGMPIGGRQPEPTDNSKEINERIARGDSKAGIAALMADDSFVAGIFGH